MDQLITYLLQSSASIILFYVCFSLMLRKESYFGFNRMYLISALTLSSLLPFFSYNLYNLFTNSGAEASSIYMTYQLTAYQLNEVVIGNSAETTSGLNMVNVLLWIYFSGVLIKTGQFLFRILQLYRFSLKYEYSKIGKLKFVVTEKGFPTFSFLNYIFISPELFKNKEEFNAIIQHESVHSEQYHSIDLIASELFLIIQWFNPFAYLLTRRIKENHEFLADSQVVNSGYNSSEYRLLLAEHASIIQTNMLTHNFSYSLLKRRLFMMKKPKNPIRFGLGIIGVIVTSALVTIACSRADQSVDQMGDVLSNKSASDSTYTEVDNMPQFPGGMDSLVSYLSSNIVYPAEAKDNDVSGKVLVDFVIDKDGSVEEVSAKKGIGHGCDEEAVRVISAMPDWIPGTKDGKAVRVSYVIPISFTMDQSTSKEEVFTVVEDMPEYPGGFDAMVKFLSQNIKYPDEARRDSITGRVFVSFVVEKDGQVSDVSLLRGIGSGCDEEAIRVVAMMPKWKPGIHEGKAVRVKYNLPIKFALN